MPDLVVEGLGRVPLPVGVGAQLDAIKAVCSESAGAYARDTRAACQPQRCIYLHVL